ncbi:MAG: hypothetical protein BRC43_14405 [Cyanobacteria bacterium QS_3_48_167]|nr:MAG: hypothetical protein BRC43_14405 [Cyanobacteria bacterium QS_3_48_167]
MPDLTPTSRKTIQRTFLSRKLSFLLDNSSEATTALGLRRLNRKYEGAILRIRLDTTDYPEFDIGFDGRGDLDTRKIQSLLESYSATEAWVPVAYDQSGNGLDATQATASKQPLIVSGGEILDFVDFSNLTVGLSAGNYQIFVPQKYGLEKTDTYTQLDTSDFSWRQSLDALIVFSLDKTLKKQKITLDLKKEVRFAPEQINWDGYNGLIVYRDSFREKDLYFVPSDLDTSNGTDFRATWFKNNLTSFPAIDLSNGTDFLASWRSNNLTSFPTIDLSNGTNFQGSWKNNNLTSFPAIDLSNGTDFQGSWKDNNLTSFPAIDLSNGTDFKSCWRNNNLTSFPAINLSNGTNFDEAWSYNSLTSFPAIDLSSGTVFFATWQINDLTSFPAIDLSNGTNFSYSWRGNKLTSFPAINLNSGTNFSNAWQNNNLDKKSAENIIASLFVNHENNSHALSTIIGTDGTFTETDLNDDRIRSVAQDPPLNYSGSFPSETTIYDYLTNEGWTINLS